MRLSNLGGALAAVAMAGSLGGAVRPSALFTDHAVLLKSADTPVFGFAEPGEKVRVALAGVAAEGVADKEGRWLVRLDLRSVGEGPFELKMNEKTAKDVLVGEVWLCSGQSNMSFDMGSADDGAVESKVVNPRLRCFLVTGGATTEPRKEILGRWLLTEPGSTPKMTAVGYHFAKYVQDELKVPFGIVESAVGAASIEAWCDPVTMAVDPAGKRELDRQVEFMANYRAYEDGCDAANRAWAKKWNRADRPHGGAPKAGWRPLKGKELETFGLGPGAVWFRRKLASKNGRPLRFVRKRFIEKWWCFDSSFVEVYWNGRRVARTFPDDPIEKNTEFYELPGSEAGEGTLDVRVFNAVSIPDLLQYLFEHNSRLDRKGWLVAEEFNLPWASAEARSDLPKPQQFCLRQHWPTGLYNGMVEGLVPMGLSGVIWYQGESNTRRPEAYGALFPTMIKSWRKLFQKPELPFGWCQLAAYKRKATKPAEADESWPVVRDIQTATLKLPMTGQAVLIDAGEECDIHPRDKRTPGRRLAAWALNAVYGKTGVPYRGPRATGVRAEGASAVVTFADCGGGLVAHDLGDTYARRTKVGEYGKVVRNSPRAQVEGFAVAGEDGVWQWADEATIVGWEVRVSSGKVAKPVRVRYGWSVNPWVNLYNAEGFPAVPFALEAK